MSKVCQLTGKKTISGNNVSHSNVHTKRKFYPNLHNISFYSNKKKQLITLKNLSTKAIRNIQKALTSKYNDIYDYITDMKNKG